MSSEDSSFNGGRTLGRRLCRMLVPVPKLGHPINPALLNREQEHAEARQNRVADKITSFSGSMLFVYVHVIWFACWIGFGAEDYPYGLLTMIVSLEGSSSVRPDDRGGIRGVGTHSVAADTSDVVSRYLVSHPAAVRPDDRGGIRGVGTGTAGVVTPAPDQSGSVWGAAELAAASTLGALALALLGFALIRHRRSAAAALQS
jgi:hypothetical protein